MLAVIALLLLPAAAKQSYGRAEARPRTARYKPYSRVASKDALKWADKQLKQMSLEAKGWAADFSRHQCHVSESGQ